MLKQNSVIELSLLALAIGCLLGSAWVNNIQLGSGPAKHLLLAAGYGISGLFLISKMLRFRHLVGRFAFLFWHLAIGMVLLAALVTAYFPEMECYTLWMAGILIFLHAGQNALLHKHY